MATYAQRSKLTLGDLGSPKILATRPETERSLKLGVIMGKASGFVERSKPNDGSVFEGLKGAFRAVPSDETREGMESGVLFIPDAFHSLIAEPLRAAQVDDRNASVDVIFEVWVIRANNPQGYSWELKPVIEFAGENPLDRLQEAYEKQIALPPPTKKKAISKAS